MFAYIEKSASLAEKVAASDIQISIVASLENYCAD
jgi:hypothetical protein